MNSEPFYETSRNNLVSANLMLKYCGADRLAGILTVHQTNKLHEFIIAFCKLCEVSEAFTKLEALRWSDCDIIRLTLRYNDDFYNENCSYSKIITFKNLNKNRFLMIFIKISKDYNQIFIPISVPLIMRTLSLIAYLYYVCTIFPNEYLMWIWIAKASHPRSDES